MSLRITILLQLCLLCAASLSYAGAFDWLPWVDGAKAGYLPVEEQDKLAAPLWETGQSEEQVGKNSKALETYEVLIKRYPGSRFAPMASFRMAELHQQQGKFQKAFKNYELISVRYPQYEDFNAVVESQFQVATTTKEKKTGRFLFIPYHNYSAAVGYYEAIVRNAPFSEYAPQSLMHIAEIHRKQKDVEPAVFALERLVENYPKDVLAPDAYLGLGDTYAGLVFGPAYDQGATRDAIAYYEDFLILYPQDDGAAQAENQLEDMYDTLARSKLVLGNYYYKYRKNYQGARVFLNEAITISPNSAAATEARALLDKIDAIGDAPHKAHKDKQRKFLFIKKKDGADEDLPLAAFGGRADEEERGVSVADDIRSQEEIEQPEEIEEAKDRVFGPLRFWKKKEAERESSKPDPTPEPAANTDSGN